MNPAASIQRQGLQALSRFRSLVHGVAAWPGQVANAWRRPWVDVGLIPGTSVIRVVAPHRGIIAEVPAVIAVDPSAKKVIAFGEEAREMEGRTAAPATVVHPFANSVVSHFEGAVQLLKRVLRRPSGIYMSGMRAVVAVPSDASELERQAIREAVVAAGARSIQLVDQSLAAALGAGVRLDEPRGAMIVNIGAGTTQVAVTGLGGVALNRSVRIGGDAMDRAIVAWLKRHHHFWIGDVAAEHLKRTLGSAIACDPPERTEVGGRDLATGAPRRITVSSDDIRAALRPVLDEIAAEVREAFSALSHEMLRDILEDGIGLCGGGANLRRIDAWLGAEIGVKTVRVEHPQHRIARGVERLLEDKRLLRETMPGARAVPRGGRARPRPSRLAAAALAAAFVYLALQPPLLHTQAASVAAPATEAGMRGVHNVSAWARALWYGVESNQALRDRIPLLEAQLAEARSQSRALVARNAHLSHLLKVRIPPGTHEIAADVLLRDPTGWLSTVTIDRGRQSGVAPRQAVITAEGLLGEVVESGPDTSRVRLITAPHAIVACRVGKASGVLYGGGDDATEIRYLDPDAPLKSGDLVTTSGLDGIYPPGLPVGRLTQIYPSRDTIYRSAHLQPLADLDGAGAVLVLKR